MICPDTFNNHFHPEIGEAAVAVLEAAGYRVVVPAAHVCCGRPLYDDGMLDRVERRLPAVRNIPKDALIVADGFSCRSQIAHATDRRRLHLAEVIWMALREGRRGAVIEYPKCVTVRVTTDSFSSELLCRADSVMNAVSEVHTMRVV